MYIQYSEGLPCLVFDEEKGRIHFDTTADIFQPLEAFYGKFLAEDVEYFAMSEPYAAGFHAFMKHLDKHGQNAVRHVKGQVTGPISYGLMITDEKKRAILYNETLFDAVLKQIAMKARWQIRRMKALHPDVIIILDEPYLSSFGSAFINITREQVIQYVNEVIEAVHGEGALAGVHCCGNTDWTILMETGADILSFDAYGYFQSMAIYPDQLGAYLGKGGALAWGIVPTSVETLDHTAGTIVNRLEENLAALEKKGCDRQALLDQALITPSCGMGALSVEFAERVAELTRDVSARLQAVYYPKKE
jgi:methionine synthase II (cobalamin-independent)